MLGSKLCCARQTSFDGILRPWELTQHKPAPGWWKNCLCCTTVYRPNDVPFADERERYLRYCAEQGATPASLKIKRNELLWIAKRLDPDAHLGIGIEVLQQIGNERQSLHGAVTAVRRVVDIWRLRFLGWWHAPPS
jgi:hypothetical protein